MTNTNSRTLRDEQADSQQNFSDLPNPRDLELGAEAQSGQQQSQQRRQEQAERIHETDDADLPKEFRGKSVHDLVGMLEQKEQMIGRQANEIGHLRDLSDQLLKSQTSASAQTSESQSSQEAEVQISDDEIFTDPRGAIQKVVTPLIQSAVKEIKDSVTGLQTNTVAQQFASKHPTYEQDMQSQEFQKFVQGSAYRQKLAQKAYQNNDFEAADELWTAWEEQQASSSSDDQEEQEQQTQQRNQEQQNKQQQQLRDASTVRAGNGEQGGGKPKPVYSASKLQDMRNSDPDGYYSPSFQKMIMEAYREGRVR